MSRSGYSDDCDGWALIRWRGAVTSAIRGQRGQAMLRELAAALDALPEKRLAAGVLATEDGGYCALGTLGRARGMDMAQIDPDDPDAVARAFGVAEALASEVMWMNDATIRDERTYLNVEVCGPMRGWERHTQLRWVADPRAAEKRWQTMRRWVASHIKVDAAQP